VMKTWQTILGGQLLDPKVHSETEQIRYRFITENIAENIRNPYLRYQTGCALRIAKADGYYEEALEWAKARHRHRLNYDSMTQRQWQSKTRRQCRARHHDSVAIREKYVRCLP
jgi:hypothetical protein